MTIIKPHIPLTAYIFTGGRATFEWAYKSFEQQTVSVPIHTYRNMPLVKAMNDLLDNCPTRYFIKIDDDFFMHPRAIEYMTWCIFNATGKIKSKAGLWEWKLYEHWSDTKPWSFKIYDANLARQFGGFQDAAQGRIDWKFEKNLMKKNFNRQQDQSVVSLHAASPFVDDQLSHEKFWTDNNRSGGLEPRKGSHHENKVKKMRAYKVPLETQFLKRVKWIENNNEPNNKFKMFLKNVPIGEVSPRKQK